MEKTLRVLGSGGEEGHGHSHSHSQSNGHAQPNGTSTAVSTSVNGHANGLTSRKVETAEGHKLESEDGHINGDANGHANGDGETANSPSGPSKLSAYLNLFGDFVHNMYVYIPSVIYTD